MKAYEAYIRWLVNNIYKYGYCSERGTKCSIELDRVLIRLTGIDNYFNAYDYLADIKGYNI